MAHCHPTHDIRLHFSIFWLQPTSSSLNELLVSLFITSNGSNISVRSWIHFFLPLSADALEAIRLVKKSIHEAVLHMVDLNKLLSLSTDASKSAIRAVLSQEGQPVAFIFKSLSAAQQQWSPAELEGFAVVMACQEFCHYIANRLFNIFCDQHGFVQVLNLLSNKGIKMRNSPLENRAR